jgi:hypothetical protein
MAKFGQGFIQSLTQPGYSQGLFELGTALGQAPAVAAEKRERESMLAQIKDMTPLETADYMLSTAKTPAQMMAAKTARQGALIQSGKESLDVMQSAFLRETNPKRLQELENAMIATAQQTGNASSQFAGAAKKKTDGINKQEAVKGIDVLIGQISNPESSDTLVQASKETALQVARDNNVPVEQVRQAVEAADKKRVTSVYESETLKINMATRAAEQILAKGETKQNFTDTYGEEYGYVFDDVKNKREIEDSRLKVARDNLRATEYKYTDKELKDFGLDDNTIDVINAMESGAKKNAAVFKAVLALNEAAAGKPPNASLIGVYAKGAVNRFMEQIKGSYDDEDEVKQAEAMAYEWAVNTYGTAGKSPEEMAAATVNIPTGNDAQAGAPGNIAAQTVALMEEISKELNEEPNNGS